MLNSLSYEVLPADKLQLLMGDVATPKLDAMSAMLAEAQLSAFNVPATRVSGAEYTGDFWAPALQGNNIAEHFEAMAKDFLVKHGISNKLRYLLRRPPHPKPPAELTKGSQAGWNRFVCNGDPDNLADWTHELVDEPIEDAIVEDCETFVQGGWFASPIIATACNPDAQYIWLSPAFMAAANDPSYVWLNSKAPLVPIGRNKLVVCHNIGYDAVRTEERYELHNASGTYYLCTMAMNMLTNGLNNGQRWAIKAANKPKFMEHGCANSLIGSWEFHVGGRGAWAKQGADGDKSLRDIFVTAKSLSEIHARLPELLAYACNDTYRTHELYRALYPKYRQAAPSDVTLVAHLLLGASVAPCRHDYTQWAEHCRQMFQLYADDIASEFAKLAKSYYEAWLNDPDVANDFWLRNLDWTVKHRRKSDGMELPNWYVDVLYNGVTTRKDSASYLLKLSFCESPIRKLKKPKARGWCARLIEERDPATGAMQYRYGDGSLADSEQVFFMDDDQCYYVRLPHKDGEGHNVGNPLASSFSWRLFGDNPEMSAGNPIAKRIQGLHAKSTFWVGYEGRISSVGLRNNILAPAVVPHNTVSNRTGEALFLTLPSRGAPRIGSEVKSKLQAPPGHAFVTFDFDSQELAIASAYSDSYYGINGTNAFSFGVLAGDKSKKTDPHSMLAAKASKEAGLPISRDGAKQSIYAMLYGAMLKTVANTMRMWHPELSLKIACIIAKPVIVGFKGTRSQGSTSYSGGQASAAFNKMHDLTVQERPATPILDIRMQPAMHPEIYGKIDAPDQLNWVVQSAGSSMLQCIVVSTWWLAHKLKIPASLAITIHDEIWTYVKRPFEKLWAYCMQIGHAWCWSLLHYKLGIYELPTGRMFASGIGIDTVCRKNVKANIKTPTNSFQPRDGKEYSMAELVAIGQSDKMKERWSLIVNA